MFYKSENLSDEDDDVLPLGSFAIVEIKEANELHKDWGRGIQLKYKVLFPLAYKGKPLQEVLCVGHSSSLTRKIAQKQMDEITKALNLDHIQSASELIGKKISVKIGHKPHFKYEDQKQETILGRFPLKHEELQKLETSQISSPLLEDEDVPF